MPLATGRHQPWIYPKRVTHNASVQGNHAAGGNAYRVAVRNILPTYPAGVAGCGLLLLRAAVAAGVLAGLLERPPASPLAWLAASLAMACCMLGVLTRLGCLLAGALVLRLALLPAGIDGRLHAAVLLGAAASLWLLGPGAYALDARLFGRKVLRIRTRP